MKIQFYTPSDQPIPLELSLKIDDDICVYYKKIEDISNLPYDFGWQFVVYDDNEEKVTEIIDGIVKVMCWQSAEHGSEWCPAYRSIGEVSSYGSSIYIVNQYFKLNTDTN